MSWSNQVFLIPGEFPVYSHVNGGLEAVPQDGQEITQTREQIACLEPILDHDNEIVNPNVENSSHNKRRKMNSKTSNGRKLTSGVWDDFKKYQDEKGNDRARCNHCKNDFDGSSTNGTTHLRNHLKSCPSNKNKDGGGNNQADHGKGNLTNHLVHQDKFVINQELNQLGVVRAIIKYGLSNINSIKPDILQVYYEEKEKLRRYFTKLSCRFSLVIKDNYQGCLMVLHFTDDNWELKQKAIGFNCGIYGVSFGALKQLLLDWNVDKNICSVVTDTDTEELEDEKSSWLAGQGSLPFGGFLFLPSYVETFARQYNRKGIAGKVGKIEECLRYVSHKSNKQNFQIAVEIAKSKGKKVTARFLSNSTECLKSLEMAIGFKEAFYELEQMDSDFEPINFTMEEWDDAQAVYGFLKVLNDAAHSFMATKCPTANAVFPKICDIYSKLLQPESENHHVLEIASCARGRFFNEYWYNSKFVLAIAVFLDPRYKMDIIQHWYHKIYGVDADGHIQDIVEGVNYVYKEYAKGKNKTLDEMWRPWISAQISEIELYLKESKISSVEEFDILNWWQLKTSRYPILARMARDFLSIPISPAASNSWLDTDIEEIMSSGSVHDELKLPFIYTRNWLRRSENN